MLVRAVRTVVADAVRHAPRGSSVRIDEREHADAKCTIEVANEGPPIR